MPSSSGPNTVNDSVIFAYDVADIRNSYIGEPTTNLLPTPETNAIPKIGNGWGTYNTNQYNGGNYFSIGTISSVSSNVVTTAGTHPLRTYDAVTPQTTGGGVTNGTNYFVKKISDTQFSLHEYNGSQDGSQGYISTSTGTFKVYDSIATDTRVSINSTSFPTMWWGPPHVPNSGLVKEIISNGFKDPYTAIVTDCIRLHWHRPDGVTDGMAYEVDATTTPSTTTTVSFWARAANAAAVGKYIQFQNYNYGGPAEYSYFGMNATWGALGEWVRNSYTFTATHNALISYWFPSAANIDVDISNIQVEQNSHRTTFVAGTRSVTNSLLDLSVTGKTIDVTNVSFDSNSQIVFDNTNDYISTSGITDASLNSNSWTAEAVVKFGSVNKAGSVDNAIFGHGVASNSNGLHLGERTSKAYFGFYNNDLIGTITLSAGVYYLIHWVYNQGSFSKTIYVNGVYDTATTQTAYTGTGNNFEIGRYPWAPAYLMDGNIYIAKIYNRTLSSIEIANNYRAYKSRFNLS
jgi:hypothetical protein